MSEFGPSPAPEEINPESTVDVFEGKTLSTIEQTAVILPEQPWLPTHGGLELRVANPELGNIFLEKTPSETLGNDLRQIGQIAVVAAEAAKAFAEADDPNNPDWYDKPWFNLNFNSHLEGRPLSQTACQVYLRPRTLGQGQAKAEEEYSHPSDAYTDPYWTIPVPVDYPLNPDDRRPYEPEVQDRVTQQLQSTIERDQPKLNEMLENTPLFTDQAGRNTLTEDYPFQINPGNYPVWQKGEYLLVTQDNPLIDREHGLHLVLIYRGEQQDESERFSYHWRDPRRIAEMAIIAEGAAKVIMDSTYAGNQPDQSYVHLNANWSLNYALPEAERHPELDKGSVGYGQWPGTPEQQTVPGPNAHPHIQLVKKGHTFDIAFSPAEHGEKRKDRQTDFEISILQQLLAKKLTPAIEQLAGQTLVINQPAENTVS